LKAMATVETEEVKLLRFDPFKSTFHPAFWNAVTTKKLEEWKLDETPKDVVGYYQNTTRSVLPSYFSLDFNSLDPVPKVAGNSFVVHGLLYILNTLEKFAAVDKKELMTDIGKQIWNDIDTKVWLQNPSLLNRFILLVHIDAKKYLYDFMIGFPAFNVSDMFFASEPEQFSKLDVDFMKAIQRVCLEAQRDLLPYFVILKQDDEYVLKMLNDPICETVTEDKIFLAFADPSASPKYAGWPLRNFLKAWKVFRPDFTYVRVICWRYTSFNSIDQPTNSLLLHISMQCDKDAIATFLPVVGWEKNSEGKVKSVHMDLSAQMDPNKIAQSASKLNLHLMRWRIVPELNLGLHWQTSCLLFGAGTLGCNIARCLGAWGFGRITFVDNGRVSYSNPARQSLYSIKDCIGGRKWKCEAAASALKDIYPDMEIAGERITVPMPGHFVDIEGEKEQSFAEDVNRLERLVSTHDIIFLLFDTREARWLPTLLSCLHNKIAITVALGFDSYLILRHGFGCGKKSATDGSDVHSPLQNVESTTSASGANLACYFCCDVTAPGNSTRDRTLDQQCTVTRPGVSMIASGLACELVTSLIQHPLQGQAPVEKPDSGANRSCLGVIPHQIRGYVNRFDQWNLTVERFASCIACSEPVIDQYKRGGFRFVADVCNDPTLLETITGLDRLKDDAKDMLVIELAERMIRPDEKLLENWKNQTTSSIKSVEDRLLLDEVGVEVNTGILYNTNLTAFSVQQQRVRLPIYKNRDVILYLIEKYQTLIIFGETGCAGWAEKQKICVSEPRRVAAVTLATRVAEERASILGHEVGYVVRFDDFTQSDKTRIKFMTDGILVREIMKDPLLNQFSVVIVDEAHERNVNTDITLGLLRKIIAKRPELRLIISSATLDAQEFHNFFNINDSDDPSRNTSFILSVEGRTCPVDVFHLKRPIPDYVKASVITAINIHRTEPPGGDILIFLTGQDEVVNCCDMLKEESKKLKGYDRLWIVPIYGALPFKEQIKVFDSSPSGTRKVTVATNIAEASITIPGVVYVIDCGFVKMRALHPDTGIESLMIVPISQASAQQRSGRAGRIRPGKAFRLYPESEFDKLRAFTVPEIQRIHLAPALLQLKALGINNVLRFHYLSRPPAMSMSRGLELLLALGAIDEDGKLTSPLGVQMAELPLPPMHAKALLVSGSLHCSEELLSIMAMLQVQDIFLSPFGSKHKAEIMKRKFSVEDGDHLTMLNIYSCFTEAGKTQRWCAEHYVNYKGLCRATEIRAQLFTFLRRFKIPIVSCLGRLDAVDRIKQALVSGFFSCAAKLDHTGTYRTIRENFPLKISKGSALMYRNQYPKWIIFNEVMQDSMRDITAIDPEWLLMNYLLHCRKDMDVKRKHVVDVLRCDIVYPLRKYQYVRADRVMEFRRLITEIAPDMKGFMEEEKD
ncbi:putative ATP-dependent RNA helicase DHX35 -like protein, partial [Trichinella patagoniensis]